MPYKLNIQLLDGEGNELIDKQLVYSSLDHLGNANLLPYHLAEEAKHNEEVDGEFRDDRTEDEVKFGSQVKQSDIAQAKILREALDNGLSAEDMNNSN